MTTKRSRRVGLVLVSALATVSALLAQTPAGALPAGAPKVGMVCTPGSVSGGTHTFNLVANGGNIQTPDGNTVFMWSYSVDGDPDFPAFQSPGPVLCVTEGQTVEINLRNDLPDPPGLTPAEATSIVFPGQDAEVTTSAGSPGLFTTEVAPGNTITYTFTADEPGTYLYESGSDIEKQIEMGLYGALIVRPSAVPSGGADPDASHYAYNDSYTRFDPRREFLVLLADIDPDLHHAVETGGTYDFTAKHDRYFTINGRSFPDTIQENGSALLPTQPYGALVRIQPNDPTSPATNQPALIRMLNAGTDNHPFHPHGNHTREIAQDGRLLIDDSGARASTEHFGETIGSGQTEDFLLRWDDQLFGDNWNPTTNPLPVAQPNYRNLTFKDGLTWYSGTPYLGYKGTLPTGTTSLNVCGEWYFPLHSHALNEFTNFDEGFGGMGTLLRVDPLGGCFASPASTTISAGTLNGGSATSLAADDALYYKVNSTTTGTRTTDWYGQFGAVPGGAANLKVTYKGNDTFAPSTQNFNTLATTGTSSTLPPTNTAAPPGWALAETGAGANATYAADNGGATAGNTYSYGSTANADRAFGGLRGTVSTTIGARFVNNTGGTITSLGVSYTGELWRYGNGSGTADRLDFQYSTNATSLTTGTWTDVNSLDFNSPGTGPTGARNGNASGNRTAVSSTINGTLSIAPGATYWLRWTDFNRTGTDDGLAVDDFSLTPAGPTIDTTVSVWNWSTSSWVQVAGPTPVGAIDVTVADNTPVPAAPSAGSWASYIGTGANKGVVRVRVLSTEGGGGTANFVTGGNLMKLLYDAP